MVDNIADPRLQKMAEVIVNYSLEVKPGQLVLFRGTSPLAMPLMQALYAEALKVGANAYNYIHMSDERKIALQQGSVEQLSIPDPMLMLMYEQCDAIVRIEAEEDTNALKGFPREKVQAESKRYNAPIGIQFRREADESLRRCTTLFPTESYARDAGMTLQQYEDFVYSACMVHLDNPIQHWLELSRQQQRLCDWLKGKKRMHVRGANIDLQMSLEGRNWENADGKFNFPDGEIFTGPVEDSVNGWVKFTYPALYSGNRVEGAELHFTDGLVTKASATDNEEFLIATLDTDPGARRLGEFAIGTNRGIQQFTGQILFDEKIGGTVHMAIGQSYPKTGAVNKSSVHWDMICDMMSGGEIIVDGTRFYENGQFLV